MCVHACECVCSCMVCLVFVSNIKVLHTQPIIQNYSKCQYNFDA